MLLPLSTFALSLILGHSLFAQSPVISADKELLQGRWFKACEAKSAKTEHFVGSMVTLSEMYFLDPACGQASLIFISEGSYEIPAKDQIDFKFLSVRVRLQSDKVVTNFNDRKVCGFSDWILGVEKEISGRSCEIFFVGLPQRIPTVGEMRYGIYLLKDNRLSFGKLSRDQNATTPEKRPTEIHPRFYTKVPRIRP